MTTKVGSTTRSPTAGVLVDQYEDWMHAQGLSRNTIKQRVGFTMRLIEEWGSLEVTAGQAGAWLRQFSGWTATTYHNHLKSIFAWMVETGQVDTSPLAKIRRPPSPSAAPKPLTWSQLNLLLEDADGRLRAWLLLGALAGQRVHEIAKIRGRDVSEDKIRILGKGAKLAFVPTHPVLWELAQSMPSDEWWFPSPHGKKDHITGSLVSLRVRELFRRHGLDGAAHRLRATYGTELMRRGVPLRLIQELLRHSNLATTEHYLGVDQVELETAVRLLTLGPADTPLEQGRPSTTGEHRCNCSPGDTILLL